MTEKEKAQRGFLYNPNDDNKIQHDLLRDQMLCASYNALPPDHIEERMLMIQKLLKAIGTDFKIEQPFHCDFGYHVRIGEHFFSNYNLTILACADVTIGDYVFIAPNCGIYTAGHPLSPYIRNQNLEYAYPVNIGSNVWIGANVSILPGVTIGNNTTIAAGSTVTHDIPSDVLAGGIPCKVLRRLTEG